MSDSTTPEVRFDQLCAEIQATMTELQVPGVAVGIWHDGAEYTAGLGVTNIRHPQLVTPDTLFQIGSTTKTFTATLAMALVENEKLDLDRPIRDYLPEFRLRDAHAQAAATLRHCFTHTGGWLGDYFTDTGPGDDALARYVDKMAELPQLTPLGELWAYNNAGFSLAGRVMEVVAQESYEAALQKWVLDPLGLEMTFLRTGDVLPHRVAVGHQVIEGVPQVAVPWPLPRSATPAGGITSTVRDQLAYARFHLGDGRDGNGNRLISPARLRDMQSPLVKAGSMAEHVGISWLLSALDGVPVVGHGGATNGQMSAFSMVPSRNFAVTILTNANQGRTLHGRMVARAYRLFLGLTQAAETALPQALTGPEAAAYTGEYHAALNHLQLYLEEGIPWVQVIPQGGFPTQESPAPPAPPPAPAAILPGDRLLITDGLQKGARGEFLRDSAGNIVWLRYGGRLFARR